MSGPDDAKLRELAEAAIKTRRASEAAQGLYDISRTYQAWTAAEEAFDRAATPARWLELLDRLAIAEVAR